MTRSLLAIGLVVLLCGSLTADTGGVAKVVVKLPRDARLFVDSVPCPLTGEQRSFETPPLDLGRKYEYTLTVEINDQGEPVRVKRAIVVEANKTTVADFGDRAAILVAAGKRDDKPVKVPDAPKGPPPVTAKASVKDGKLTLEVTTFPMGEKAVVVRSELALPDVKAIDTDGNAIAADKLAELLATERVVLVSDRAEVDAFYLSTAKKGTIVLIVAPKPVPKPQGGRNGDERLFVEAKNDRRPNGTAPDLVEATLEDGQIVVKLNVTVLKEVQQEVTQLGADGKPMKVVRAVTVPEQVTRVVRIDPKKSLLSTADGKDVAPDDVKRFLEKPAAIVLSSNFEPVDKFYLQLYDEKTLVVVPPTPGQ